MGRIYMNPMAPTTPKLFARTGGAEKKGDDGETCEEEILSGSRRTNRTHRTLLPKQIGIARGRSGRQIFWKHNWAPTREDFKAAPDCALKSKIYRGNRMERKRKRGKSNWQKGKSKKWRKSF